MRKELLLLMTFTQISAIGRKSKVSDWPLGRKEGRKREREWKKKDEANLSLSTLLFFYE